MQLHETEQKIMFNVTITYKSGKIEKTQINVSKYSNALASLEKEKRITSIEITSFN